MEWDIRMTLYFMYGLFVGTVLCLCIAMVVAVKRKPKSILRPIYQREVCVCHASRGVRGAYVMELSGSPNFTLWAKDVPERDLRGFHLNQRLVLTLAEPEEK